MFRAKMDLLLQQKALEESKVGTHNHAEDPSSDHENELLDKLIDAFGAELEEVKKNNREELGVQYAKFTRAFEQAEKLAT